MLCEYCGVREAEVELLDVSREGIKKYHLCRICAEKVAVNPELIRQDKSFRTHAEFSRRDKEASPCPVCGWTLSDYHRTGELGCASCYFAFNEAISEELKAFYDTESYEGAAYHRDKSLFFLFENFVSLVQQIDIAVAEENFEGAAQLSEKMKTLKERLLNENS